MRLRLLYFAGKTTAPGVSGAKWPTGGPQRLARRGIKVVVKWALMCLNSLVPKVERTAVVYSPKAIDDGILSVMSELDKRGLKVVHLDGVELLDGGLSRNVEQHKRLGLSGTLQFMRAKYVFVTHGLYWGYTGSKHQSIVNLWHGEPGGKAVARFAGKPGYQCDVAPVTSHLGRAVRSSAFGLHPERVPITGAPRNDRMIRADEERARDLLSGTRNPERVVLWLPTHRGSLSGSGFGGITAVFEEHEWRQIDRWAQSRDALVVVKRHPLTREGFPSNLMNIRYIDDDDLNCASLTLYEALKGADCLVTDISSVWQDYLLLDRPMICAFPDIQEYRESRGFILEPYEAYFPGPVVRTSTDLVRELDCLIDGVDEYCGERALWRRRLHQFNDDQSASRLLDHLNILA